MICTYAVQILELPGINDSLSTNGHVDKDQSDNGNAVKNKLNQGDNRDALAISEKVQNLASRSTLSIAIHILSTPGVEQAENNQVEDNQVEDNQAEDNQAEGRRVGFGRK